MLRSRAKQRKQIQYNIELLSVSGKQWEIVRKLFGTLHFESTRNEQTLKNPYTDLRYRVSVGTALSCEDQVIFSFVN